MLEQLYGRSMNDKELQLIRQWDKRCGDNELTLFPVTIDRRRLLEYVDQLKEALAWTVSAIDFRSGINVTKAPPRVVAILETLEKPGQDRVAASEVN
jgi:hypothetical protein